MRSTRTPTAHPGRIVAVVVGALLAAVLLLAAPASANTVEIFDASHVLDATRIYNEAAKLADPVRIYTTTKDATDNAAFDRETASKVSAPDLIVIAMNTQSHHLAIRTGAQAQISPSEATAAAAAFRSGFAGGDYTGATLAALDSLRTAVHRPAGGQGIDRSAQRAGSGAGIVALLVGLAFIVVIFLVIRGVFRRLSGWNRPGYSPPPGYPAAPPYGPQYGPPARSGLGPLAAGGLGAAAGGLVGYELGRMEGEREGRQEQRYDDAFGAGDWSGGGADADFGGGGDFNDTGNDSF